MPQPEIQLSTRRLKEIARLVVKYKYEGDISWLLQRVTTPSSEYWDKLCKKEYEIYQDKRFILVNLHEEDEIKEMRLKLLDEFAELKSQYTKLIEEAKAIPRLPLTPEIVKHWPWRKEGDETEEAQKLRQLATPIQQKMRRVREHAIAVPWPLQFDEVGRAIRTLKPLLGTPNYTSSTYYELEKTKVIGWRHNSTETFLEAANLLLAAGIKKFTIDDDGTMRLKIRVPDEIYPQAFYNSDDPEVWRKIQSRKQDLKKIREVVTKLERI
jgi:hypothetical protein